MRSRVIASAVFICCSALLAVPGSAQAFGLISAFAPYGQGAGQASLAIGLAIGPDGLLYATDFENRRIDVFSPDGSFIRGFGKEVSLSGGNVCTTATGCQKGANDGSAGAMYFPVGVAIDPTGTVYVADASNYRVDVFSSTGTFIRAFGKEVSTSGASVCTTVTGCKKGAGDGSAGALFTPRGVGIGPAGTIYVSSANERIDVFSPDGTFIRAFGKKVNPNPANSDICTAATGCQKGEAAESAGGMSLPFDVAVSAAGDVAVTDANNDRIDVFDSAGTFVRAFGKGVNPATSQVGVCTVATGCRQGTESGLAGGLAFPSGIALNDTGNLVVADHFNHRIDEFAFDGTFVRAFGEGVIDGKSVFQVCTTATGCVKGIVSTTPGAIPNPYGTTADCRGGIYTTVVAVGPAQLEIERFGEPGTAAPPCPVPPEPQPSSSSAAAVLPPSPAKPHKPAKPTFTIELNKGSGTASLVVVVSDPGTLLLRGKGIRRVKRRAKRPGLVELLVAPTVEVKDKLEKTGKATVKMSLTFKSGGESITQAKAVTLKLARLF